MDIELPNLISRYKQIKWEQLLKRQFSEFSLTAAEPNLNNIKSIFDKIIDFPEIYSRENQWKNLLKNQISEFLKFIQTINDYSDTKEREKMINNIKDKEYQLLADLKDLLFIVDYKYNNEDKILERLNSKIHDTIVLEVEDKIKKEFDNDKMIELSKISDDLIRNKSKISEATSLIESMNKEKEIARNKTLEGRALSFAEKANEHRSFFMGEVKFFPFFKKKRPALKGTLSWLILSFIFALFSAVIVYDFINIADNKQNISLGFALLRISSLIIPSFIAIFCAQQYLNHRKLYEAYKYRDIALNTMKSLMMESSDQSDKKEILSKGLDVIFSEPTVKDDNVQKEVLNILKDVVVNKVKS